MAEITQYQFSWAEIAEALIKRQNLHEGEWLVGIEFVLNIGAMGTSPESIRPGAMILANQFQLVKAVPGQQHPLGLVVDAAVVNPAKATKESKSKRAK